MSDSLQPHESRHSRTPCQSQTPGVYSNPCPLSRWCHPAISSSVVTFSSCPQSLLALGSFPMSQLFAWGGHANWSFSFSISPSNEHPGLISFRMDWFDLLAVQETLKSLLQHHSSNASIFRRSAFFTESAQTIHILLDNLEVVWTCKGDNKGLTASKILGRFAIAWTSNELPS